MPTPSSHSSRDRETREAPDTALLTEPETYGSFAASLPGSTGADQGWGAGRGNPRGPFVNACAVLTALGAFTMFVVIAWAISSTTGSFGEQIAWLVSNPWGVVSLVDLYVGFSVFSLWIWFRERNAFAAAAWTLAMMTTGWLGGSAYVFNCLRQFNGDWQWFFMGNRRA